MDEKRFNAALALKQRMNDVQACMGKWKKCNNPHDLRDINTISETEKTLFVTYKADMLSALNEEMNALKAEFEKV